MADLPTPAWLAELTRFDPPKTIAAPPDWDAAVQLLAHHGLAPLAGYNLQYRMPGSGAPDTAKDVLLGYLQGVINDNVFKLVTLKNLVGGLSGVQVVLLDGAAFADVLYPHVGFRPVPELRLLVPPMDVRAVVKALEPERFVELDAEEPDPDRPAATLFNERFHVKLYATLLPNAKEEAGLFERAAPAKAYGSAVSRLAAEDALLVHALSMARRGFAVPLVQFVDLRELVKADAPMAFRGGPGAPIDPSLVRARAKAFGVERALWAALELLAEFHPEVAEKARSLQPEVGFASRTAIEAAVLGPARDLGRMRTLRGTEQVARLLLG